MTTVTVSEGGTRLKNRRSIEAPINAAILFTRHFQTSSVVDETVAAAFL